MSTLDGLRVLVVDDQELQRRLLVRLLAGAGVIDVLEAVNGRDGLDLLERTDPKPDVVISDIDMPEMDGVEFIRNIAQRHLARAVVVSSALDPTILRSVHAMATAYGLEVLGTLEKPTTTEALAAMLGRLQALTAPSQQVEHDVDLGQGALVAALAERAIVAHFQPKVSFATGQPTGVEALARWLLPEGGMVPPSAFVPPLEQHGLVDELTEQMLAQSCEAQAVWNRHGLDLDASVNVSASSLADVSTADRYFQIVTDLQGDPRRVTIEVTESAVISDLGSALDVLTRLRVMGFKLSIDDFGTGYASMEKLGALPFSELKIDQTFVHDAVNDSRRRTIIETSLNLASKLGLHTVAEGVETRDDWDLLYTAGCHDAQGWFIAKAMPADDLVTWAAAWVPPS